MDSLAATAVHRKVLDYLEAGTRLVWIVDADSRTVRVHRTDGSGRLLREGDVLEGEDVLEGFSVLLESLFG